MIMEENKKVSDQSENTAACEKAEMEANALNQAVVISDNILCKIPEIEEKTGNPTENKRENIYEKLMEMRVDFTAAGIKKSGRNDYSKYDYYTLDDFLSICTKIAASHKVLILYSIDKEAARLNLHNLEDIGEVLTFSMPLADATIKGGSAIQNLGSQMTYTKRYLYMNVFEIAEPDMMDENLGRDNKDTSSRNKPQTVSEEEMKDQEEVERVKKLPISAAKVATIYKLMEETGVTVEEVCRVYKISKIEEIREEQFPKVMQSFEKQKKKNEAKKNAGTNQNQPV